MTSMKALVFGADSAYTPTPGGGGQGETSDAAAPADFWDASGIPTAKNVMHVLLHLRGRRAANEAVGQWGAPAVMLTLGVEVLWAP